MAAITIRQIDDDTKQRLRMRAAANGRSMESEARAILEDAVRPSARADLNWVQELIVLSREIGGADIPVPPRNDEARAASFE